MQSTRHYGSQTYAYQPNMVYVHSDRHGYRERNSLLSPKNILRSCLQQVHMKNDQQLQYELLFSILEIHPHLFKPQVSRGSHLNVVVESN